MGAGRRAARHRVTDIASEDETEEPTAAMSTPPTSRFIDSARPWQIVRSYVSRYKKLARLPLRRRKVLRRYIELSPRLSRRQVLYDRTLGRRVELEVRNLVDLATLEQVFLNEDYGIDKLARCAELLAFRDAALAAGKRPLIIDCGGNIGFASRYFAENHPGATVLCIEPEPANAEQARRNNPLPSVVVFESAVGSEPSRGRIVDPGWGNNAYRIDRSEGGATEIITIDGLLERYGPPEYVPFIAKIDIEGFEAELFTKNTGWIERFPLLIIELHDWMLPRSAGTRPFLRAISAQDRDFMHFGENVFSISNTLL
jgi:FkbM family methyltransferase